MKRVPGEARQISADILKRETCKCSPSPYTYIMSRVPSPLARWIRALRTEKGLFESEESRPIKNYYDDVWDLSQAWSKVSVL